MRNVYHSQSYSKLYAVWSNMRMRCNNPNNPRYKDYGGRGISVCNEWNGRNSFLTFKEWAISSGYREGFSLERVNNDLGYSPENCVWITNKQQHRNTRSNRLVSCWGETKSLVEWEEDPRCSVSSHTLSKRLDRGWKVEKALVQRSERAK